MIISKRNLFEGKYTCLSNIKILCKSTKKVTSATYNFLIINHANLIFCTKFNAR